MRKRPRSSECFARIRSISSRSRLSLKIMAVGWLSGGSRRMGVRFFRLVVCGRPWKSISLFWVLYCSCLGFSCFSMDSWWSMSLCSLLGISSVSPSMVEFLLSFLDLTQARSQSTSLYSSYFLLPLSQPTDWQDLSIYQYFSSEHVTYQIIIVLGLILGALVNTIFTSIFSIHSVWSLVIFEILFTIPFGLMTLKYSN